MYDYIKKDTNLNANNFCFYTAALLMLSEGTPEKTEQTFMKIIIFSDFNLNGMKYGPNISRSLSSVTNSSRYESKEKLRNLKSNPIITVTEPGESLSRRVRSHGNLYINNDDRRGRRRLYDSSAESTTEGDSSQHSAKSMIYLHAATGKG